MNVKKLLRGPLLYILLAIVAVWIGSSLITMSGFREVSTQEGLQFLKDGKVASAKIVDRPCSRSLPIWANSASTSR